MFDAFKPARIEERDEWINLIKKYKSSSKNKNSSEIEEPLKILKFRFAKGEISKKEYNQMKKELNS
ncbi:MAG: SHOCT domain-containing protein [Candidatus Aenigmarchaeota archaeon]|nr:SHOCT domain-containing protein [Candidatus Aenigmarchaeota archaeon]